MVVIIILSYNQNEYTLKCVDSILSSQKVNFHLIIIENGSEKENQDYLLNNLPESENITLEVLEKNIGYVGGVNFGLKKGLDYNPDHYLIMNNDTIIDNLAIFSLLQTTKKYDNRAIVTGKVYYYDEPNKFQDIGYTYTDKKTLKFKRIGLNEMDEGQYDTIEERDLLDDVFWLFPFELYNKIGGYSTDFWFNAEQADFVFRAKKVGYKLIYSPKAKLWHKGSVSIGGRDRNPKGAYWHMQSTLILRYKYLSTYQFCKQYFYNVLSIISSYYNCFKNSNNEDKRCFEYAHAKLKGMTYFNKWFFLRNENKGKSPF